MMETNDTVTGDDGLSIDQAAAAYVKATTKEAPQSQSEDEDNEAAQTDDELQASDEDASEEADGETEDEGQAEDENDEEPDSDQGRFVASNGKVRLPDGTVSTVADLVQGNLRDRDYRQKTMEAAEVRKTYEAQSAAVKASEEQLNNERKYVSDLLRSVVPAMPPVSMTDPKSPDFDPVGYNHQRAMHEQWVAHLQYLDGQREDSERQRKEQDQGASKEKAQAEWQKALAAMPELKDAKKVETFGNDILKYGPSYGYTPDELARAPEDHRQLLVLKKAIAWDKLQASKANVQKKVEGRPPVQKGGKRLNPSEHKARSTSDAMNRLKQSGTVEDATAAYLASLNKG